MNELAAAIDMGGTHTAMGLVDRNGRIFDRRSFQTHDYPTPGLFWQQIENTTREMMQQAGQGYSLAGIGMGAPSGNERSGQIDPSANLPWKESVPVSTMAASSFPVPFRLMNDANAAALGEMLYGAARGMKDFILITLGTGLGSGLVVNGQLVTGYSGSAGELGHVTIEPGGRPCGCGRNGCLETYVSATGLVKTMQELMATTVTPSILRQYPDDTLDALCIYSAASTGDLLALEAFDHTSRVLGSFLANAVAFTEPQAIILYGGLARAGEMLLLPTRRYMEDQMLFLYHNKVALLGSSMPGEDAALLGAAATFWESIPLHS